MAKKRTSAVKKTVVVPSLFKKIVIDQTKDVEEEQEQILEPMNGKLVTEFESKDTQTESIFFHFDFDSLLKLQRYINFCCEKCNYRTQNATIFDCHLSEDHVPVTAAYQPTPQPSVTLPSPIKRNPSGDNQTIESNTVTEIVNENKVSSKDKISTGINDSNAVEDTPNEGDIEFDLGEDNIVAFDDDNYFDDDQYKSPFESEIQKIVDFTCLKCEVQCISYEDFIAHIRDKHIDIDAEIHYCKDFVLKDCSFKSQDFPDLAKHIERYHPIDQTVKKGYEPITEEVFKIDDIGHEIDKIEIEDFECIKCSLIFDNLSELFSHINDNHTELGDPFDVFLCNELITGDCDYKSQNFEEFCEHIKDTHPTVKKSKKDPDFDCFVNQGSRIRGKRPLLIGNCVPCKKKFPTLQEITTHILEEHDFEHVYR